MPAALAFAIVSAIPFIVTAYVLWWISANPKSVDQIGTSMGQAFGQAGKGVGEGIITPLLEYSILGGIAAAGLALLYRAIERISGEQLGILPPSPPAFAPAPQFGAQTGIEAGPVRAILGTSSPPLGPPPVTVLEVPRSQAQNRRATTQGRVTSPRRTSSGRP